MGSREICEGYGIMYHSYVMGIDDSLVNIGVKDDWEKGNSEN